jgi:hypothetical protein
LRMGDYGLVADNTILREIDIALPGKESVALSVILEATKLQIEFDGNFESEVPTPVREVHSWTGGGDLILAFTGQGDKVVFTGVSVGTSRATAPRPEKR